MLRIPVVAACCLCALVLAGAWAQDAPQRQTKPFESTQQRKGSCVMPEMPAAITYTRIGANGQTTHTTSPCREDEGACGMSLNTYANGSHMCIAGFRNQESCRADDCKTGWRHRCTDGWWKKTETCLPGELKKAKLEFAKDTGAGRAMAGHGGQGDSFAKQIEALKPELDAREKAVAGNVQCGALEPDQSDIVRDARAAAHAGGLSDIAEAKTGERLTIEKYIASYGSLDEAIRILRGQVAENQRAPSLVDCTASRQHAAICEVNRILARGNQRTLDWFLCHKRARG